MFVVAELTLGLGDTVRIAKYFANLTGRGPLFRELGNLLNNGLWGGLEPRRRVARVGDGRG